MIVRLPTPTPPAPTKLEFDVLISQTLGMPATGMTVRNQPTGGSEFQVVVLAEALAARGYSVGVVSPVPHFVRCNGVHYVPIGDVYGREDGYKTRRPSVALSAQVLVSERFGELPPDVGFDRIVFDLHDLPDPRIEGVMRMVGEIPESRVVVHSEFAKAMHEGWPRVSVIPCMLPDEFYGDVDGKVPAQAVNLSSNDQDGSSPSVSTKRIRNYVYGSAAMKGLAPTITLWNELKRSKNYHFRKATLTITSPGYDQIEPRLLEGATDVRIYTGLSPAGMQQLLAASDGLFMVSSYPETFGIVMHQCEVAGKPAHILQTHGNEDALYTTLGTPNTIYTEAAPFVASFDWDHLVVAAKDFRVSTHIDAWIDVLGLKQSKENAA